MPNRNGPGPPTQKTPEAVPQFQTTLPTVLTQQLADRSSIGTLTKEYLEIDCSGFLGLQ